MTSFGHEQLTGLSHDPVNEKLVTAIVSTRALVVVVTEAENIAI